MAIELTKSPEHHCRGCVRDTCVGCPEIQTWLATIVHRYVDVQPVPELERDIEPEHDEAPWEASNQ